MMGRALLIGFVVYLNEIIWRIECGGDFARVCLGAFSECPGHDAIERRMFHDLVSKIMG
jgi:hypothetical protein